MSFLIIKMFQYILVFFLLAFVFTVLLAAISCASCFGLTSTAKDLLVKLGRKSYDRQFEDAIMQAPLNTDCFICLERVSN